MDEEKTLVDVLTSSVCEILNQKTPAQDWDDQTKNTIGAEIHLGIAKELVEVINELKSLEPIIVAILQGHVGADIIKQKGYGDDLAGKISKMAFDIMNKSHDLVYCSRIDKK